MVPFHFLKTVWSNKEHKKKKGEGGRRDERRRRIPIANTHIKFLRN